MASEFKYQGETFLLDDSKGCYIEVTYKDQVGYVGVKLQGTQGEPYCWWADSQSVVTPEGLTNGLSEGPSLQSNVQALCKDLIRRQQEAEARKSFDSEAACKSLHEFVETISA